MITDQAATEDDGTLVAIVDKLLVSNRLRIACVISGRNSICADARKVEEPALEAVRSLLVLAASQADVKAGLPAALKAAQDRIDGWETGQPSCLKAYFALWSERPDAWVIGSTKGAFPGLTPYEVGLVEAVSQPPVDRSLWPERGHDLTREVALRLIEQQRRTPAQWGAFNIGGAAELVRVDGFGIRRELICRWPDRIGQKIDPRPWWKRLAHSLRPRHAS